MQVRHRILAVGLLTVGLVLVAPGAAGASEESVGSCFLEEWEAIVGPEAPEELSSEQQEALEEAADECIESPSPIVPAVNELIWGGLFFLVVLLALSKWAFPALKQGVQQREDRIRGDLEQAEHAREEGEQVLEQYRQQLHDARDEAARIIEEAREAADEVRRDLSQRAEREAAEIRQRADEDIAAAAERATSDLQERVGELAIELAERVVERNLDRDTQMSLIESYINEVGRQQT